MQTNLKKQSFAEGAALLMVGTLTVKAVGMLFKIPLSNLLGATGYSYFTGAYELFNLFSAIAALGFPVAVSKLVAENSALGRYRDNRRIMHITRAFLLATGIASMAILMLGAQKFAAMIPNPGARLSIICLAPAVVNVCLMSVYRGYYQGMQNMYPTCISQILEAASKLVLGLGMCMIMLDATEKEYKRTGRVLGHLFESEEQTYAVRIQLASAAAVLGVMLSTAVGAIYLIHLWRKQGDLVTQEKVMYAPKPYSKGYWFHKILMIGFPVCLGALLVDLSGVVDLMTVTSGLERLMQTSPKELLLACKGQIPQQEIVNHSVHNYLYGIYSGKTMVIANLVPAMTAGFAVSALPAVSESFAQKKMKRTAAKIETVLRLTAMISIPMGLGLCVLSEESCRLFFGNSAENEIAAELLQVCGLAVIFASLIASIISLLQAIGKVYLPAVLMALGSAVKWVMNRYLVMIPQVNVRAAAYSSLFCYALIAVLGLTAIKKKVSGIRLFSVFAKPAAAGLMCAFCALWVQRRFAQSSRLWVLVSASVGAVVYLLGLFALGGVKKEEIIVLPQGEKMAKILEKYELLG